MKITDVQAILISIPLRKPTAMSGKTVTSREYVVTRVHTDEGITGSAYTLGGSVVLTAVNDTLKPLVMGADPFDTERLWDKMFRTTLMLGRKGAVIRGLSTIDIALWDIKGRALGQPLYKLLGAYTDKVPVYSSGGYYRQGESFQEMADEMAGIVERGFLGIKIKVGLLSFKEEVERIRTLRRTVGDGIPIRVDANCAWNDLTYARKIMRAFEEYNIDWFEEPVLPDNFRGSAELAATFETPIATGEQECTRWGFRDLIEHRAGDILQPDVAVVGGVTEWMKVAALASAYDLPISSHYFPDVHVHLMAAIPNALIAEYFPLDLDIMVFDHVVKEPLKPEKGYLPVPKRPGLGMDLDEEKLKRYRVA
ncbi:MAG: mandelate racemase/muconate lactonizing enzyme family protein [Deltaproteobacteria bacterium]|nr:mandelate racemase/muconate lactonizing enzyme family protein [Deltaproteobacteria bacterium]